MAGARLVASSVEHQLAEYSLSLKGHLDKLEYESFVYKIHFLLHEARRNMLVNPLQIMINLSDIVLSEAFSVVPDHYQLLTLRCTHLYLELALTATDADPKKIFQSIVDKHKEALTQIKSLGASRFWREEPKLYDVAIKFEIDCIWECLNQLNTNGSDWITLFKAIAAFAGKNYTAFAAEMKTLIGRFPYFWYWQVKYVRQMSHFIIDRSELLQDTAAAGAGAGATAGAGAAATPSKTEAVIVELLEQVKVLKQFITEYLHKEQVKTVVKAHDIHFAQAAVQALADIAKYARREDIRHAAIEGCETTLYSLLKIGLDGKGFKGGNAPIRYFAAIACVELLHLDDEKIKASAKIMLELLLAKERKEYVKKIISAWPSKEWLAWVALRAKISAPVAAATKEMETVATALTESTASVAGMAFRSEEQLAGLSAVTSAQAVLASRLEGIATSLSGKISELSETEARIRLAAEAREKADAERIAAPSPSLAIMSAMRTETYAGAAGAVLPAFPSSREYALLASAVSYDDLVKGRGADKHKAQAELYKLGWELQEFIADANGYRGAIFINTRKKQVVIAHRDNQNFTASISDYDAIVMAKPGTFVRSAIDLLAHEKVLAARADGYRLSSTGHAFGGLLAQICTFWSQRYEFASTYYPAMSAVVFDSPGAVALMEVMRSRLISERDIIDIAALNIINFCAMPNLINTFGKHTGSLYYVVPKREMSFTLVKTHLIEDYFLPVCPALSGEIADEHLRRITDWPEADYSQFSELLTLEGVLAHTVKLPFYLLMQLNQALRTSMGYRTEPTWFEKRIGGDALQQFKKLLGNSDYAAALTELAHQLDLAMKKDDDRAAASLGHRELALAHFDYSAQDFLRRYYKHVSNTEIAPEWHRDFAKIYDLSDEEVLLLQSYDIRKYGRKRFLSLTDAYDLNVLVFRHALQAMLLKHPGLVLLNFSSFMSGYSTIKITQVEAELRENQEKLEALSTQQESLIRSKSADHAKIKALTDAIERLERIDDERRYQLEELKEAFEENRSSATEIDVEILTASLSAYYQKHYSHIERLFDSSKKEGDEIDKSFVNLSLVKETEQAEKEARLRTRRVDVAAAETEEAAHAGAGKEPTDILAIRSKVDIKSFEEIHAAKEPIDYEELITKTCNENGSHHVLVLGKPGVGKTTFLRRLCYDWAQSGKEVEASRAIRIGAGAGAGAGAGTAASAAREVEASIKLAPEVFRLSDFKITICLPLRAWHNSKQPLYRFLKATYFKDAPFTAKALKAIIKAQSDQILWLIDGYDEVTQAFNPELKKELTELLDEARHYILTSRPYYDHSISFDKKLEIIGFEDSEVATYIKKYFKVTPASAASAGAGAGATAAASASAMAPSIADDLIDFIKADQGIYTLAHIPIMLELICIAWSKRSRDFSVATMTELYVEIIRGLVSHYLKDKNPDELHVLMLQLGQLAYASFKQNQLVFVPYKVARSLGFSIDAVGFAEMLKIGVLKLTGMYRDHRITEGDYYFVHLTLQEYFCAYFIAEVIKKGPGKENIFYEEVLQILSINKYHPRYEIVLTFITGRFTAERDVHYLNQFFSYLLAEPRDLVGIRERVLMLRLINETKLREDFSFAREWLEVFGEGLLEIHEDKKDLQILLAQAVNVYPRLEATGILNGLIADCLRQDLVYSGKVLSEIIIRGNKEVIFRLLTLLKGDWRVKKAAIEALGKIVIPGDKEVILHLLPFLSLPEHVADTREGAIEVTVEALGQIAIRGDQEVISRLLPLLDDTSSRKVVVVIHTLSKIASRGDGGVVAYLLFLLENTNFEYDYYFLKVAIIKALGEIAILESDNYVRFPMLNAMGQIVICGAEEVIKCLLPLLCDADPDTRFAVIDALEKVRRGAEGCAGRAKYRSKNNTEKKLRISATEVLNQIAMQVVEEVILHPEPFSWNFRCYYEVLREIDYEMKKVIADEMREVIAIETQNQTATSSYKEVILNLLSLFKRDFTSSFARKASKKIWINVADRMFFFRFSDLYKSSYMLRAFEGMGWYMSMQSAKTFFSKDIELHLSMQIAKAFLEILVKFLLKQSATLTFSMNKLTVAFGDSIHSIALTDKEWSIFKYHVITQGIQPLGLTPIEISLISKDAPKPLLLDIQVSRNEPQALAKALIEELIEILLTCKGCEFVEQLSAYAKNTHPIKIKLRVSADEEIELSLPKQWQALFIKHISLVADALYSAIYAYGVEYWDDAKTGNVRSALLLQIIKNLREPEVLIDSSTYQKIIRVTLRDSTQNDELIKIVNDTAVNKLDLLRLALASGADTDAYIDGAYLKGVRVLHLACKLGRIEYAKALLAAGAEVDAQDSYGRTALQVALASFGKGVLDLATLIKLMKLLCSYHADVNYSSRLWCDDAGRIAVAVLTMGISELISPMRGTRIGWSSLHLAAYFSDSTELIELLLSHGADPGIRTSSSEGESALRNKTALELAELSRHSNVAKALGKVSAAQPIKAVSSAFPVATVASSSLIFSGKSSADDSWYDDERIAVLLQHYCSSRNIILLEPLPFDSDDELTSELIRTRLTGAFVPTTTRYFLPLRIGYNHWVGLLIDRQAGNPLIHWLDPFGNPPTKKAQLLAILNASSIFDVALGAEHIYIQESRLQEDGFNCGPWLIEILRFILERGYMPGIGEIHIEAKRSEHRGIFAARSSLLMSSMKAAEAVSSAVDLG
jgi:ankyrin repeat protein/predicted nucleotide-binding protein (sugar kinase/HSP70/actin superfamily)